MGEFCTLWRLMRDGAPSVSGRIFDTDATRALTSVNGASVFRLDMLSCSFSCCLDITNTVCNPIVPITFF